MTPKSSCFVTSLRSPRIEITILRRPEASAARAHGTGGVVDSCNAGARRRSSDHQTQRRRESQVSYLDDPADVSKNKPHVVHLSAFALAVWDRMCEIPGDGEYVFEGRDGGHVSETEVTRRLTDRQTRNKPIKGRKNSTVLDLPGGHWTQHDLRRTGATIMGELNISSDVIDLCLNHKKAKKTTRTYQRQTMLPRGQRRSVPWAHTLPRC